jgi:acetyl esterase/lipase
MNIDPINVYLAGDSAGGNLACALTANILKNQLHIPKGIYLAYPALDFRNKFSLSRLNSFHDPLLWPTILTLIRN